MKENEGETLNGNTDELDTTQLIEDKREKLKTLTLVESKLEFISTIENPCIRVELVLIEGITNSGHYMLINDINLLSYTELIELLRRLNSENKKIVGEYIRDVEKLLQCLEAFSGEDFITLAKNLPDELKIQLLDKLDDTQKVRLISTMQDSELKLNAFDRLENQEHAQALKRLYQRNIRVGEYIDLRILDKQYLETLGDNKIHQISRFKNLQEMMLSLNKKEYTIFVKCLNAYITQNGVDNWREGFDSILRKFRSRNNPESPEVQRK